MPRRTAERMQDHRRPKRGQALPSFDRSAPELAARRAREAGLVRGHGSTRVANEFLAELWDERLGPAEDAAD